MLPPQLLGVYRQYKEDTDSVASWLASTAKSCGYPADLLASQTWDVPEKLHPRIARLKGKARKQALNANPGKATTGEKASKYVVAIKDFLPLANYIAGNQKPVISVPPAFVDTIDRLIKLRARFGDMMEAHGQLPDAAADQKHGYSVGVLQGVREALRPRMPRAAQPETPSEDSTQTEKQDLGGRFASLSLEEPSQAFVESFLEASPMRPKPKKEDPIAYEAEPQTSVDDLIFAYMTLVNDLNRIRSRIAWIWSNWSQGAAFDLAAAAVATNVAISLARNLVDEILPLLEKFPKGVRGLIDASFFALCLSKGHSIEQVRGGPGVPFDLERYDIANAVYAVPHTLLRSCLDVLQPRAIPLYKEGMFGTYDPASDRSTKSGAEKFQEDKILILEFFTDLMTVIRAIPDYPVEDEFMRGMRELDQKKDVSLSVTFAAQIFLDIHHMLRAKTALCFHGVAKELVVMHTTLREHLNYHKDLKVETWAPANDGMFRHLAKEMETVLGDQIRSIKADQWRKQGQEVPEMEKNRILVYSPVLSGLYLFNARTKMHEAGTAVANAWGSIVYTGHLYNAIDAAGLSAGSWKDMDVAITLLGEESFWVGAEAPRTLSDAFKKFCLQMGVSASNFTQNRRRKNAVASRAGPRGIKEGLPVSRMFEGAFTVGSNFEWTSDRVKDIVDRTKYEHQESPDGRLEIELITDPQTLKEKEKGRASAEQTAKSKNKKKKKKVKFVNAKDSSEDTGVDPADLIKDLTMALHSESMEMTYPHLLLHRSCWNFLRKVKASCESILIELHTPSYIEQENQLPWLVGWVLGDAAGFDGGIPDPRPLAAAAEAFNEMVTSGEGESVITILREEMGKDIAFDVEEDEGGQEAEK